MRDSGKTAQLRDWGNAILRVLTGYLFLAAGVNKLFYLDDSAIGVASLDDSPIGVAIYLGELLFGAALIAGLLTRWVCIPLALLMLADIFVFHQPHNLFEQQSTEYEYALLRLGACITLALTGPGKVALDNILAIRRG
jgi:putative oxidoreductase